MLYGNKKGYQIYHSLIAMMLTYALILWVNGYFVLKVHGLVCVLYSMVPAALLHIFDKNKKNTISYAIFLGLLPIGGLVFLFSSTNPITWVSKLMEWIISYDRTEELYELAPAYTILAFLSLLCSIIFYILVKNLLTRLLLVIIILTLLVVFGIFNIHTGKVTVGISIFYILNIQIEFSSILYSKKTGKKEKSEAILYLLPICLLLAAVSIALPSKSEPMQWTGVKNVYNSVKDRFNKIITEWEFFVGKGDGIFSISLSGYSEDGGLDNEDLVSNYKIALIVTGRRGQSPIYLTGSVSDIYTGSSWEKSKEGFLPGEQEYQMDYGELIYGLSRLETEILEDYRLAETKAIKIIYNNIKTRTFFYPAKTKWFRFDNRVHNLEMELAGITFPKATGSNMSYNLSYYEMNLQSPEFQEMLRMADDFSYNESRYIDHDRIKKLENDLYVRDRENFILSRHDFYDLYKERADAIYNRYTQLPEELPIRVKELVYELTKDEDNNYDKLKAIESYLIGLEYSYTPGKVPKGADFVDYFLFDNKKGYCTSFATAMAVLARAIGIPTRYIEGYVVDYGDQSEKGYLVRNSNAHAWAEAYFDGVGWIPFEATPAFHEQRYVSWAPKRRRGENNYNYTSYYNRVEDTPIDELIDGGYESIDSRNKKDILLIWALVILTTVIIMLSILISYYHLLQRRYWWKFNKSDNNGKTYMIFLRILTLLKYEGFSLRKEDTLLMLSDRIKKRYKYNDIVFHDVASIFMALRYGGMTVTDEELDRVNIFYRGLKEHREDKIKGIKLYMEEWLFLMRRKSLDTNYQD